MTRSRPSPLTVAQYGLPAGINVPGCSVARCIRTWSGIGCGVEVGEQLTVLETLRLRWAFRAWFD